jgi:primosomal protein N' (replication factor Y)
VAVNAPLRGPLDYRPPSQGPVSTLPIGVRVRVPMGRRQVVGVVVDHAAQTALEPGKVRAVLEQLDAVPLLDEKLLALLRWTADYYHHPLGEVIAAALPKALRAGAPATALQQRLRITPAGNDAVASGEPRRAPRQRALLQRLAALPQSAEQLDAQLPGWRAAARELQARGWIEAESVESDSPPATDTCERAAEPELALTAAQQVAVAAVDGAAGSYVAFALHGATGSGKTEVYLQCALRALARGQSVLVLIPEIGLTPQLLRHFRTRLRAPMAVLHSGLTDRERLAAWRAARAGTARVVLGTRSAVFAPLQQLGLIIVDEEHDASYKQQDSGCRYSARDLAVVRAQHSMTPVLLGSATLSLETLHNVELGRYRDLRLPRRADQAPAPRLVLTDLRAHAPHAGFAAPVLQAIERHLAANGQVIVFINRRGYAPTLLCTSCGWIAPCSECDARMTVHRAAERLRCHHCGAESALPSRCPRCGFAVKPVGQGTERIEETLRERFPDAGLARLDRDTARSGAQLHDVVQSVLLGRARILIGTQMLSKGHHFPDVTLVVVLNADQGLFSTDFRAAERLAQTIIQVAGRAGRERIQGEVLIQTEYPEHPLLQDLLRGGYEALATTALIERRAAAWPPFGRLGVLRASGRHADAAMNFLTAARTCAPQSAQVRLLGPVPAAMTRRAGRYYAHLLLESAARPPLQRFLDAWLLEVERLPQARRVRWALDIDPIDIQ